jgi:L-amino acid N-acyltransferase YncA
MDEGFSLRDALAADGAACARVYAPYVLETAISFESEPPSDAEMGRRIGASLDRYAWLVLEVDQRIVGYAYGTKHNERHAYRWSTDVSVYLEVARRRMGAGRALYDSLFERLRARGYRMAVAGITLPNEASIGLHRAFGFQTVGIYRDIGFKLGAWHDVEWMQRPLAARSAPLVEPARGV